MRTGVLLIMCVLLFSCREKRPLLYPWQEGKLTAEQNGLKGKIKTIIENTYFILDSSGKSERKFAERAWSSYDAAGYLIESNTANNYAADSFRCKNIYSYNAQHKLIEEKRFNTHSSLPEIVTHKYDDRGNDTLATTQYQNRDFGSKIISTYDADNRLTEQRYFPVGNFTDSTYIHPYITRFKYDDHIGEISSLTANNIIKSRSTFKYDANAELIEQCRYDQKGDLTEKIVLSYSDNITQNITYDPNGNIISKGSNKRDSFDRNGNSLKIMGLDSNGKLHLITERKIEYYQ